MNTLKNSALFVLLFFYTYQCLSQKNLSNGYYFPPKNELTPLRVLLVPVELHGGLCDGINPGCYQTGQIPDDIDDYFDATLPSTGPTKHFTKLLYQASFGKCVVLGDYLDQVVHVNYCPGSNPSFGSWLTNINAEIRAQFPVLPLHHPTPLADFDLYNLESTGIEGVLKTPSANSKFDCVIYLIKNFHGYGGESGFGMNLSGSVAPGITTTLGVDIATAFGHHGHIGSIRFIMTEFFHGLFGHNNWHGGAGASNHTFFCPTPQWGLESQGGSSQVVSGYDRWIFDWTNPPDKLTSISARNLLNAEVASDLSIPSSATTSDFVLRDFVTSGDVIRIKLPHINCSSSYLSSSSPRTGEEKNQYLWIENHQLFSNSVEDQNLNHTLASTSFCGPWPVCGESWTPGLFCSIQVGKDDLDGGGEIYGGIEQDPNSLGSWMFPMTADGNHDYTYSNVYQSGPACIWGNPFVAFDFTNPANTKPNPFSGYSFLFGKPSTNGTNELHDGDANQGVAYLDGSGLNYERSQFGGSGTSFKCNGACPSGGKEILSISTNPSPLPLMTLTSGDNFDNILSLDPNDPSGNNAYLNRTVYLNGISVSILSENFQPGVFGPGAVHVRVKWDNYDIINNVRWCADSIRLSSNDFNVADYSLNVKNGSKVLIDRSLSPTYDYKNSTAIPYLQNFTVHTTFTCLENSKINVEANGEIIVDNGSVLELMNNSRIDIQTDAKITVKNGGKLILNPGSLINVNNGGRIIIEDDGTLDYFPNATINLPGNQSVLEIKGTLKIEDGANFTFTHPQGSSQYGYVIFSNTALFPSRNISAGVNCKISFNGNSQSKKLLQIDQETFYAPPTLDELNITNGKVEFNTGSRLQADGMPTILNFNNAKFTSNTPGVNNHHRGVHLYGQKHVNIDNCVFEYGTNGIFGLLQPGGIAPTISNSIFRNCSQAIEVYAKGIFINNCFFYNNSWSIAGAFMDFPSTYDGGNDDYNTYGLSWHSYSSASFTLNNPHINHNVIGARIDASPLSVICGTVSFNNSGFVIRKGGTLLMDDVINQPQASYVTSVQNNYTIQTAKANYLYLKKGYNDLSPSGINNNSTVNGSFLFGGGPFPMQAFANRWNLSGTFSNNDYDIVDPNGNPLTIDDQYYLNYSTPCGQAIPPCPQPPCDNWLEAL